MKKKSGLLVPGAIPLLFTFLFCLSACRPEADKPFLADLGVCTGWDKATMLSEKGFSYIEAGVRWALVPEQPTEEFTANFEAMKESPLPVRACNSFIPGNLKSVGPEADHEKLLAYADTAFRRARMVGIETIVFGSGGSRGIPEGFPREEARSQFIELCKAMGPIAEKYDVVVVLEPLNTKEVNFINSVAEGGEIVREIDHPNVRLLADIYHMMMEDEGPESITEYGDLIRHTHIAEKEGRAAPGTHGEDFTPYLKALKDVGYKGRMSIECRWENMEAQAGPAIEHIKKQLETI